MSTLETYVNKANWPTDIEEAKAFAKASTESWKWKKNIPAFLRDVDKATSVAKLQYMTINAVMKGEGLGVI